MTLPPHRERPRSRSVELALGVVVEDPSSGFVGEVVGWDTNSVRLIDRYEKVRSYPIGPGFWIDGQPVELVKPDRAAKAARRTASGSIAVSDQRAKVALASRIYVEGRHDAELVEKVWGDDLRHEGVVVEYLGGIDDLPAIVAEFEPRPDRRLGVLVDHLVAGSKESRIAEQVADPDVLIVGHPFVDIWQAVKPARLGLDAWPQIPRGVPWKQGVLAALDWPRDDQADVAQTWRRILASVTSFTDLEPELLGRVEELIDFVTGADR